MFFNAESAEAPSFLSNELRYINLDNYPQSVFPASFKPVKLITLKLSKSLQKELWKGYPHLPHLKVLQLQFMRYLLCTPDFDRLPCLQRLTLHCCGDLEEIHPSLGNHVCLEDLSVSYCEKLRLFPTIVRMRKLKTLVIYSCSRQLEFPRIKSDLASLVKLSLGNMGIDVMLSSTGEKRFPYLTSLHLNHCYLKNKEANFYASENLEEFKLIGFEMSAHLRISWLIWLQLVLSQSTHSLRKLDLSKCRLRDGEIPAHIGALSNLSELKLSSNDFSRLDFSLLQLTQLKHLALNNCNWLVELPKLPSSLEILEETMLMGKAIRNHFMLLRLQGLEIAKGFTPPLLSGIRYTLKLPDNWCNDYSGFLMCAVVKQHRHCYQEIYMEHVMSGMDSKDDVVWEESDGDTYTWVFYVSFAILRNTTWWNSTYKAIMIRNIHSKRMSLEGLCSGFGVRLVAWESGSGQTETIPTTDEEFQCSHYSPKFGISQPSTTFAIEFTPLLNFVGVF
ncbi:hypothetical protein M8C21_024447 [Ambrosia artemisiifolia]|uniref:Uncharacterized protein n=1 Tax=Ambrosia artemisiifolia TaxID=4212 RepID=A0AAD5CFU3_AMBAR|nr:hypothetical protein M8C21_024447 [Ambrosia artemisiifolia]